MAGPRPSARAGQGGSPEAPSTTAIRQPAHQARDHGEAVSTPTSPRSLPAQAVVPSSLSPRSPVTAGIRPAAPAAAAVTPRDEPISPRVRSPSPSLSISSVVREPWSAYSRAYAIELYKSPTSPRPQLSPRPSSALSTRFQGDERQWQPEGQQASRRRPTVISERSEVGTVGGAAAAVSMPLGIWDTKDGRAPGTVTVMSDESREGAAKDGLSPEDNLNPKLKYDESGPRPILLVPQPTDDPNDPLNWPRRQRDLILVILSMMSVIASTLSPLLAANTFTLTADFLFQYTFTDMALLTGYHLLAVGLSGFLFVATARVWGKRHLYLLGTILIIASSAWGGATGLNYNSLLGARIVQGIGLAPFEALVNASVGDLFFVHERGSRMALSNMALFGGAFFTPIIVGKMTSTIGWQWSFYLIAIFSGVMLPLIFFFVPETAYPRPEGSVVDVDSFGNPLLPEGKDVPDVAGLSGPLAGTANDPVQTMRGRLENIEKETESSTEEEARHVGPGSQRLEKMPYWRTLLPFSGRKTNESIFKLVLRPFPLFLHPAVAWACLIQGALIGWTVLMGVVLAAIFITPPLRFSEVQTGYMYAGPFIGALVGFVLSGLLADWSTKLLIRWNRGVYEPEFRIPLVFLQLVFGCSGLFGFGWTSSQVRYGPSSGWFWPDFCFALEVAGMVVGAVASALYIVDAHREIAVEAFTCLLVFKNIFSFGLTYRAFDWLEEGVWEVFIVLGSVQAGICLLSIPMYILGKRNRAFFARYNLLKLIGLW